MDQLCRIPEANSKLKGAALLQIQAQRKRWGTQQEQLKDNETEEAELNMRQETITIKQEM